MRGRLFSTVKFHRLGIAVLLGLLPVLAGDIALAADYPVGTRSSMWRDPYMIGSFRHWAEIYPVRVVPRAGPVSELPRAEHEVVPAEAATDGGRIAIEDYFVRARTTGIVVLKDGRIVYERYMLGADENSRFTSMSVSKSIVSTLLGFAIADGLVAGVDRPVTDYLPELEGSGYDGVPIKAILQMSSGIDFTEEYEDQSDFLDMWNEVVHYQKVRLADYVKAAQPGEPPYTRFNYASLDTAVIGLLVTRVTGKTLSAYLAEKLWGPLGMEADASWGIDDRRDDASEVSFCCFNATLRDYARFGLFMAQQGMWEGHQLLPAAWVDEATHPDRPQVALGALYEDYPLGYQYQWWCLPDGAFMAQGVHGQFLYVNPAKRLVIAAMAAWPDFWDDRLEMETYAVFDAFAAAADRL